MDITNTKSETTQAEVTPTRMDVWREISKTLGGKVIVEVPKRVGALTQKCAQAIINLYVAEQYIGQLHDQIRGMLQELQHLRKENARLTMDEQDYQDYILRVDDELSTLYDLIDNWRQEAQ